MKFLPSHTIGFILFVRLTDSRSYPIFTSPVQSLFLKQPNLLMLRN